MLLARVSIRNPVMVTMCLLVIIVLGIFYARTLNIEQFPQVDIPFVVVTTAYPGASPSTVELSLTKPLEESLNQIEGLEHLSSRSTYGRSLITMQFVLGENIQRIMEDVRERLSLARSRIEIKNLAESRVTRYDPSTMPVAQLSLASSQLSIGALTELANFRVIRRLVSLPGIAQLVLVGGQMPQLKILIHPDRLADLGIGVDQLIQTIMTKNRVYPLGEIESQDRVMALEIQAPYRSVEDFKQMIIFQKGDQLVTLGEVADVVFRPAKAESLSFVDGHRVLTMNVIMQSGANLVAVMQHLREEVPQIQALLPAGTRLTVLRDETTSIISSLDNFYNIIKEGVVLTVLIVFIFLGSWRSMVITAISLPVSLLASFIILFVCGYTINFLTLMALSLCVGLLIDDSIVVRENVVRHLRMGKSSRQAALDGTSEIGFAVLATTLTTVVVFLPIAGMSGVVGLYFRPFALTVVFVVLVSMVVSFTVDPMLSAVWQDPLPQPGQPLSWLQRFSEYVHHVESRVVQGYQRLLSWALRWRWLIAVLALLIFGSSMMVVRYLGTEFVPVSDYGEMMATVRLPASSSLQLTGEKVQEVSALLRAHFPEIRQVLVSVNGRQNGTKNVADIYIALKPMGKGRTRSLQSLLPDVRRVLHQVAGIQVRYLGANRQGGGGGGQNPLSFYLVGSNLEMLSRLNQQMMQALKKVPGLLDLQSTLDDTVPGVVLRLDEEQAERRGVQVAQISTTLNALLSQDVRSSWEAPNGEVYDVITALPQSYTSEAFLQNLFVAPMHMMPGAGMSLVPLRDFVHLEETALPRDIQHYGLLRAVRISGTNGAGRRMGDVLADMKAVLAHQSLPDGYAVHFEGSSSDLVKAFHSFVYAMLLVVFLIYAVLASQFKSFWDPLVIMMVLPLSFAGSVWGLLVGGQALNIFSMIGLLVMFGLSTKNSILLIDVVKQARVEGMSRYDAILRAGSTRFRPIMMTSCAMVAGMLPQLSSSHTGFETRQPMAYAVIGGVIVSTLLSLIVIPVVYTGFDDLRNRFWRIFSNKRSAD